MLVVAWNEARIGPVNHRRKVDRCVRQPLASAGQGTDLKFGQSAMDLVFVDDVLAESLLGQPRFLLRLRCVALPLSIRDSLHCFTAID